MMGLWGAIWGLAGFALLLVYTIWRLIPLSITAFSYSFAWYHWAVLLLNTVMMAYLEGYRGFHKGLNPRVVARAHYLRSHATLGRVLLAPLFCMGYFHTTKRRQVSIIMLTVMIIGFILLVRLLDQPWRGIIDVGVIVGLSWGLISLLIYAVQAFTSQTFDYPPEVAES